MPEKEIEESNIDKVIMEMLVETRVNIINSNQGVSKDYAFLKIKQVINSDYVLKSAVGEAIDRLINILNPEEIKSDKSLNRNIVKIIQSELKKAVEGL